MGAACSVGGNASLQEPLKAGPRFQLPSGPTVANPPRRIADASDAGVTLGFLQQFFKQVCGRTIPLASTPCRCARRSLPGVSHEPLRPNPMSIWNLPLHDTCSLRCIQPHRFAARHIMMLTAWR